MEYQRGAYIKKLKERRENGLIKIITGSRRAGKSYLMNVLFRKHLLKDGMEPNRIISFAFDSDDDVDLLDDYYPDEKTRIYDEKKKISINSKKFRAYIRDITDDDHKYCILLDEVQLLENFVGTLNGFLKHTNYDVYVTGSNSRFLSTDIATEFKGRGSVIHVLPLTFSEFMEDRNDDKRKAWAEYIETGGIPLVAKMGNKNERMNYLKILCREAYLEDIIERNNVRYKNSLSGIFDVLASVIGTKVNVLNISNTFETVLKKSISDDTVNKYIGYFENAFVISKAKFYDIKGRKHIGSPFKIYFEDIGVRNARLNFRQIEETHIMENIIYNELRYRGFNVDVGEIESSEMTDRKDAKGNPIYASKNLEVDFVATCGSSKYYIQSSLSLDNSAKSNQEKKSLRKIDDSFKKIVITRNDLNASTDEHGIVTMDLFDFLMDPNSISG